MHCRDVWLAHHVVMIEDSLYFGDHRYPARFHKQKLLLHRASMTAYADRLREAGHHVSYVRYTPGQTLDDALMAAGCVPPCTVYVIDPVDDMLERRLKCVCEKQGHTLKIQPSPMFLTSLEWARTVMEPKPPHRMASFYIAQRKRMNVLLDGDKPTGGAWNLDAANRKRWPKGRGAPPTPSLPVNRWVADAAESINRDFPDHPGSTDGIHFPVTNDEAEIWLGHFLDHRFRDFGTFEDAIVRDETVLHHSVLTPALNIGLLTPDQVLRAALAKGAEAGIPMNDLEGFVRQVIGWREFMMVMYRTNGVSQRNQNFWNHTRPMPAAFYDATTGIEPVDQVIRRVLSGAYCHHIERLMVLGNFMLLCEIRPTAVYQWFLELFIDAYDWVMVPNVYGMSQFADGGWLCTKPYISGSNYIRKMSNYSPGPWCEIWDGLFWRFIDQHRDFFERQPRLSMMARQLDRMGASKLTAHRRVADHFLVRLHGV